MAADGLAGAEPEEGIISSPLAELMTRGPLTATVGIRLSEALEIMSARKISELPVIDAEGRPHGLIDVTDVLGEPAESVEQEQRKSA